MGDSVKVVRRELAEVPSDLGLWRVEISAVWWWCLLRSPATQDIVAPSPVSPVLEAASPAFSQRTLGRVQLQGS